ncbi:MAG: hypothetical protein ABIG89_05240 [Candidatus Woesearchaeota archaeon]
MEPMKLGGNIELIGFDELEKAKLYVVKKIVGTEAKKISEANAFEKLAVTSTQEGEESSVSIELSGSAAKKASAKDKNLFVALDNAFKQLG